jgi:hypothetical protein
MPSGADLLYQQMLRNVGAGNGVGIDGARAEQLNLQRETDGTGSGGSVIEADANFLGIKFYAGPGPLPAASTMPNVIYLMLPSG